MAVELKYTTANCEPQFRSREWNAVVTDSYFPLELLYRDPIHFNGELSRISLGQASLSRLSSDPVNYERTKAHIKDSKEEDYLVTLPRLNAVEFRQLGRDVRCDPGGFIIERGDEPYRFLYEKPNDLIVLKVSRQALSERVRQPDRFCARIIDATKGSAGLFSTMVHQAYCDVDNLTDQSKEIIGRQLLELLGLTLNETSDISDSGYSSVRAAHIVRVERFMRSNIKNPNLSPELIAEGCGISKRYLHDLFKDQNATVSQQIREQRLIAAKDRLQSSKKLSISEVAYRFCFSDQAQFSRLFKARFNVTPSEFQRNPSQFNQH